MSDGTSTAHLYLPKLATILREGYGRERLQADLWAGLTVAIVALPLSMAIAVASGVAPECGLYAAIVGGVLVSALGGSRFQIGGPAGAFIVLVAAAVGRFGLDGLLIAVLMSGVFLAVLGALRIGELIRRVPHPVTVGFTAGIAITIFATQLKDLMGLTLTAPEPGKLLPKLAVIARSLETFNPTSFVIGVFCAVIIFLCRRYRPTWPGMLIAVAAAAMAAAALHLPVETIGRRFGDLPQHFPAFHVPHMTGSRIVELLPTALSFTLLGGIESLLSARVADSMSERKHRSNMELVAQGIANIASALFGGMPVTGTIARTATNIRAGARTPFSGIFHAGFLLIFLLAAGGLAAFIPLSALSGVLGVVCWNMFEKKAFRDELRNWRGAVVLLATFGLTLLEDLTVGIVAGCATAAVVALLGRSGNAPRSHP